MHLISPLMAGMTGAENGTATLTVRGASTSVTYYTDFEGTSAQSSTNVVNLDSSGRAEVYVNTTCDVLVKDSDGVQVAQFTAGISASAVEVDSTSIVGTNYETGASAAGDPTTLAAVIDMILTSFGSTNFNALVNGSSVTVQAALSALGGVFYNVKETTYGATGDGTTDDAAAIQAAIDACATAGGGIVFFPEGTYSVGTSLSLTDTVSLWGTGPTSVITMNHASNDLIDAPGTTTLEWQEIRGLKLTTSQANSGTILDVDNAAYVKVINCYLGGSDADGDVVEMENDCRLYMESCHVVGGDVGGRCLNVGTSSSAFKDHSEFVRCHFQAASGVLTVPAVTAKGGRFVECTWSGGPTGTDAATYLKATSGGSTEQNHFFVYGCRFHMNAAATGVVCFDMTDLSSSNSNVFYEDNNWSNQQSSTALYSYADADLGTWRLGSRATLVYEVTDDSTPVTIPAAYYGVCELERTDNAAQTINATDGPTGSFLTLIVHNDSGGALGTLTLGANFAASSATLFNPADGEIEVLLFQMVAAGDGAKRWIQVSPGNAAITV